MCELLHDEYCATCRKSDIDYDENNQVESIWCAEHKEVVAGDDRCDKYEG